MTHQNLVGTAVEVDLEDPEILPFRGTVRAIYLSDGLMALVENSEDGSMHYVDPVRCKTVQRPKLDDRPALPSLLEVATAAIDYSLQNPERDGENEYQGALFDAVLRWQQCKDRDSWVTDLCAGGACGSCLLEACECPHHSGGRP